jgi:hypothetical protein
MLKPIVGNKQKQQYKVQKQQHLQQRPQTSISENKGDTPDPQNQFRFTKQNTRTTTQNSKANN